MAAAEGWRNATDAACARHKVALFGWKGVQAAGFDATVDPGVGGASPYVVSYNTVIEGARQTDVDVTCSSVIHACVA